jgi:membrane protein YdbS with pleckstrin-like domain
MEHYITEEDKTLTVLTYPVQVVQVAADVIPQPAAPSVQHHTVLLPVVIVRLVFTPRRLRHHLSYTQGRTKGH